jgi:serine/threonine protein kinase
MGTMRDLSSQPNQCSVCGCALPAAPGGLCPRCLLGRLVVPTQARDGVEAGEPFSIEELAPSFPQLEILECLGRGDMGVVYKARQKSLNRVVALKLIAPERAGDGEFARRFEKEAQVLAALNHPHIVAVYDFGQAGGFYFLLMEYVDGINLRQLLASRRLSPDEALSIVPPVCEALQCAHAMGIVHRDIKPENLLLDRQGVVKIADFGVAKMIASGEDMDFNVAQASMAFGSADYAAPEQKDAATLDHRADIYSLGVVLYEMLTGDRPGKSWEPPSRRVRVDIRIDQIVLRALEQSPERRFATAEEFRTQVEAARRGVVPSRYWNTPRKVAVAATLCLITAGLAVVIKPDPTRGTSAPNRSPGEHVPPEPSTVESANAELDQVFSALLQARKEQALDKAAGVPSNPDRARQIERLRQRMEHLQQLIFTLSLPANNP